MPEMGLGQAVDRRRQAAAGGVEQPQQGDYGPAEPGDPAGVCEKGFEHG